MFLRRRKLILILILIGIAWAAIGSFLGQSKQTKIRPEGLLVSANRHPEFYYDTADEVIELKGKHTHKVARGTPSMILLETTVRNRGDVEQLEPRGDIPDNDHELDELEGDDLPIAPKYTPSGLRRARVKSVPEVPARYVEERRFVRKRVSTIAPRKRNPIKRIENGISPGLNSV